MQLVGYPHDYGKPEKLLWSITMGCPPLVAIWGIDMYTLWLFNITMENHHV